MEKETQATEEQKPNSKHMSVENMNSMMQNEIHSMILVWQTIQRCRENCIGSNTSTSPGTESAMNITDNSSNQVSFSY